MPIKQLSKAEYAKLAQQALTDAQVDISNYSPAQINEAVANCERVHRLLAVDGQRPENLTPAEQIYAKAFEGLEHAVVEEFEGSKRTGNLLPAIKEPDPAVASPEPPQTPAPTEAPKLPAAKKEEKPKG